MPGLLETAACLGIAGATLVLVTTSLVGAARVQVACFAAADELYRARQLEHLVDRATLAAGAGPGHPAAVSSVTADTVVFASDLNGDGTVNASGSETTALEARADGSTALVRLRLGRQTMTVLEAGRSEASLVVVDPSGLPATATTASLVELSLVADDAANPGAEPRRLLFSVPARAWP